MDLGLRRGINKAIQKLLVERIKLVAADGATNYNRKLIDSMDNDTFTKWMDYHFAICERVDLIGASHHTLDVIRKKRLE